ncbi:MAG: cache domain-containing protein [Campylobacteraceae bacterium]|nr:cache domain-containing protein [Campylobacteraceae bacterium]
MKISNFISKSIFLVSIISVIFVLLVTIFFQYNNFLKESNEIKKTYIKQKKQHLEKEVEKVYNYIEFKEKETNQKLRIELKHKVENAYNIAMIIYEQYKDKKNDDEIKELIVNILKNYSFPNKRNYYYINSNTGRAILFNKKSYLDTYKNIWNMHDSTGEYIIRKQSIIALKQGSGFVKNYFVKPDGKNAKQFPKLSYIKNFEPFNWHIGIGEYLDDEEELVKDEILNYIASIRYDENGYIFLNTINKKALIFNGEKQSPAIEYPNYELLKKQIDASSKKTGGFINYKFKKLTSDQKYEKIAFVKRFEKWGWIIGTGAYIDEIDEIIEQKKLFLKNSVFFQLELGFLFILFIILVIYLISQKTSSLINNHIENFINEFNIATKDLKKINVHNLTYKEFKMLATSLNKILEQRNKDYEKLERYNNIINEHVISSTTNLEGIITDVSQAFCDISGYKKEELIGKTHSIIRHPDIEDSFYKSIWQELSKNNIFKGEIKNRKKDGQSYWVDIIIQPIYEDDKKIGYTAIKHDITDKKRIEEISITDELTKLFNRRYFNKKIEDGIKISKESDKLFCLIMIDIDYFKNYNDTYGHQQGDEALFRISNSLTDYFNSLDNYNFRLGGEEFAVLLFPETKEKALNYANEFREKVKKLNIAHSTSKVSQVVTVSCGIAFLEENMQSKEFYINADKALYKAKESGRDKVCTFN